MNCGGRTRKKDCNGTEKENQKKSQKDMNGVIGGLVVGLIFAFVSYQIYINSIEFIMMIIFGILIVVTSLYMYMSMDADTALLFVGSLSGII